MSAKVEIVRDSAGVPSLITARDRRGHRAELTYRSDVGFEVRGKVSPEIATLLALVPSFGKVAVDIVAQSIGNIAIDIAAQTVGNITVDLAAQSVGNVTVDLAANTLGNLTVDVAAQSVGNFNIDIAEQSVGNLGIDIKAQTLAHLHTDIVAQSIGNLGVDIKAQTIGNVNVALAASTATVTITGGVTITTTGGTNIVIDKLTQGAYTERRSTLSNNGAAPADYVAATGNTREGKWFPRGCRGHIYTIDAYCKDNGAAGGTITIYIAPQIGMGATYSRTVTVPAGGVPAWRSSTAFDVMWSYDSMFIWMLSSTADMRIGRDLDGGADHYRSTDAGATWEFSAYAYWFRVILKGETIGDVPVSGTVNNIPIPAITTETAAMTQATNTGVDTTMGTIDGAGKLLELKAMFNTVVAPTTAVFYLISVQVDGGIFTTPFANSQCTQSFTATSGRCAIGEFWQGTVGGSDQTWLTWRLPIEFKRSLTIRLKQTSGANFNSTVYPIVGLVS